MQDPYAYEAARRRVAMKLGLYTHLAVYVGVNVLLVVLNLLYSPKYLWFLWPLSMWGVGLGFHALAVYVFPSGSRIKDSMIEREMERMRSRPSRRTDE